MGHRMPLNQFHVQLKSTAACSTTKLPQVGITCCWRLERLRIKTSFLLVYLSALAVPRAQNKANFLFYRSLNTPPDGSISVFMFSGNQSENQVVSPIVLCLLSAVERLKTSTWSPVSGL